jgi:hypothetical protein
MAANTYSPVATDTVGRYGFWLIGHRTPYSGYAPRVVTIANVCLPALESYKITTRVSAVLHCQSGKHPMMICAMRGGVTTASQFVALACPTITCGSRSRSSEHRPDCNSHRTEDRVGGELCHNRPGRPLLCLDCLPSRTLPDSDSLLTLVPLGVAYSA